VVVRVSTLSPLELSVRSLRDFWLDMASWDDMHGVTATLTYRQAADRVAALLVPAAPGGDSFHRTLDKALARTRGPE
jgi:hypothetical protein